MYYKMTIVKIKTGKTPVFTLTMVILFYDRKRGLFITTINKIHIKSFRQQTSVKSIDAEYCAKQHAFKFSFYMQIIVIANFNKALSKLKDF